MNYSPEIVYMVKAVSSQMVSVINLRLADWKKIVIRTPEQKFSTSLTAQWVWVGVSINKQQSN